MGPSHPGRELLRAPLGAPCGGSRCHDSLSPPLTPAQMSQASSKTASQPSESSRSHDARADGVKPPSKGSLGACSISVVPQGRGGGEREAPRQRLTKASSRLQDELTKEMNNLCSRSLGVRIISYVGARASEKVPQTQQMLMSIC